MNDIKFSMTYLALKMFGKQLYANISAAIAELVANGLDAHANNVYVYMNIIDKNNATIEIFDDGDGMDYTEMEKAYAIIGHNKRDGLDSNEADKKMGRKGIGKLAALYLTDTYYIITKKEDKNIDLWNLDVTNQEDDKEPKLISCEMNEDFNTVLLSKLKETGHGTIIKLDKVKIKNFGVAAAEALEQKLANYFLTDNLEQTINLCILKKESDEVKFTPVRKNIAFKNMAVIYSSEETFNDIADEDIVIIDKNIKEGDQKYITKRKIFRFPDNIVSSVRNERGNMEKVYNNLSGTLSIEGKQFEYSLKGWIGIHATIDTCDANYNTDNFRKNMHYNPNQLRIYVRNKLATSNFLSYLGLTATYANYLEGELSFDILDVDGLEDISTAGRDDFSVQDERVHLLIALAKGLSNKLISQRQKIADDMKEHRNELEAKAEEQKKSEIKNKFQKGKIKSKSIFDKMPQEDQAAIEDDFFQFSRAACLSNNTRMIFISHKGDCAKYGNFLIELFLRMEPTLTHSIVFTSNQQYGVPQGMDICDYLNTCFRDDMHVVFLFSRSFYDSNMCLAEAGAAWGTNKHYTNFVIDMSFDDITKPINNFQKGAILNDFSIEGKKILADELIRIVKSVGVEKNLTQQEVINIIEETLNEYTDSGIILTPPTYLPYRKFQAVPKCQNCNHPMKISFDAANNSYKFTCECGKEIDARIE